MINEKLSCEGTNKNWRISNCYDQEKNSIAQQQKKENFAFRDIKPTKAAKKQIQVFGAKKLRKA